MKNSRFFENIEFAGEGVDELGILSLRRNILLCNDNDQGKGQIFAPDLAKEAILNQNNISEPLIQKLRINVIKEIQ